jgi:hypothetical protein
MWKAIPIADVNPRASENTIAPTTPTTAMTVRDRNFPFESRVHAVCRRTASAPIYRAGGTYPAEPLPRALIKRLA